MKPKRGLKHIIAGGALLSAVLLVPGGQPAAFGAAPTSKILPVLEERIGNPKLLAKTREKLLTLQDEEIELISSLCERISTGERSARADVAFSLVTALIVLS